MRLYAVFMRLYSFFPHGCVFPNVEPPLPHSPIRRVARRRLSSSCNSARHSIFATGSNAGNSGCGEPLLIRPALGLCGVNQRPGQGNRVKVPAILFFAPKTNPGFDDLRERGLPDSKISPDAAKMASPDCPDTSPAHFLLRACCIAASSLNTASFKFILLQRTGSHAG
jgi:hypothetical protein